MNLTGVLSFSRYFSQFLDGATWARAKWSLKPGKARSAVGVGIGYIWENAV